MLGDVQQASLVVASEATDAENL